MCVLYRAVSCGGNGSEVAWMNKNGCPLSVKGGHCVYIAEG